MIAANKPLGARINANHPINKGLVGCWLLNEGAGTIAKDLAGNNNGTLTNFGLSGITSNWRPTPYGGGLNFDGSNDFISITNSTILSSSIGTWSGMINGVKNTLNCFISKMTSVSGYGINIYLGSTGRISVQFHSAIGGNLLQLNSDINQDGKWVYWALTFNGTNTAYLYINGVQVASGSPAAWPGFDTSNLLLGKSTDPFWNLFQGSLSDVMIWNRALTQNEVQQLYTNPHIGLI